MKSLWDRRGIPNPGSYEAIELGCLCPVMDNHGGFGITIDDKIHFWYTEECLLHKDRRDFGNIITVKEQYELNQKVNSQK